MDLQIAKVANIRLWKAARIMALMCFAVAGLLLAASLPASKLAKAGVAKSVEATELTAY